MLRCRRVLGPAHVTTLGAAATLASALAEPSAAQAARELGEDIVQRCRRALGPDHPITLHLTQMTHPHQSADTAGAE